MIGDAIFGSSLQFALDLTEEEKQQVRNVEDQECRFVVAFIQCLLRAFPGIFLLLISLSVYPFDT